MAALEAEGPLPHEIREALSQWDHKALAPMPTWDAERWARLVGRTGVGGAGWEAPGGRGGAGWEAPGGRGGVGGTGWGGRGGRHGVGGAG